MLISNNGMVVCEELLRAGEWCVTRSVVVCCVVNVCLCVLLVCVHESERSQYVLLVRLDYLAVHHHLVEDEVGALDVEHDLRERKKKMENKTKMSTHTLVVNCCSLPLRPS